MDNEKDLLRKDLENQKTPEEINKFVEDAELLGHEDIAELGRKKLQEISEKADQAEKTSESQISQVNELGGSDEELEKRTGEVDGKIEEVKAETTKQIEEVQNQTETVAEVTSEVVQEKTQEDNQKLEKIKELDEQMSKLLDEISSKMSGKLNQIVNSESYRKLISLNESRKKEEKELFEIYERYTKGNDSHHRSFSSMQMDTYGSTYVEDMKACGLSNKDTIKRFEEFVEKFRKPEKTAEDAYREEYNEIINEDKWKFERVLVDKSKEVFGKDSTKRDEFKKKYFDAYRSNFNKAFSDTIPGKDLYPNTMGTIYS